jgi:hypothetical protein
LSENAKHLFVVAVGSQHSPYSSTTRLLQAAVAWTGGGDVEVLFDWVGSVQATAAAVAWADDVGMTRLK